MVRRLDITPELRERITRVQAAIAAHRLGEESGLLIELPKVELADAVLAAVARQERLAGLARPTPVRAHLADKRRRRA